MKIKIIHESGTEAKMIDFLKRYSINLFKLFTSFIPILGDIIYYIVALAPIANLILLFTDPKSQTLFDKLAGTIVVKKQ